MKRTRQMWAGVWVVSAAATIAAGLQSGCAPSPTQYVGKATPLPVFQLTDDASGTVRAGISLNSPFRTKAAPKKRSDVNTWLFELIEDPFLPIPNAGYNPLDPTPVTVYGRFNLLTATDVGSNQMMQFTGVPDGFYRIRVSAWEGGGPPPFGSGSNITKDAGSGQGFYAVSSNGAQVVGPSTTYATVSWTGMNNQLDAYLPLLDGSTVAGTANVNSHVYIEDGSYGIGGTDI